MWRSLAGLGLILLLAVGALAWLIGTTSGLQTTLALADRLAPGSLAVARAEGRLWDTFTLHTLQYRDDGTEVRAERLHLTWSLATLLRERHLHLHQAAADRLYIRRAPGEPPAEEPPPREGPLTLPDIELPVRISLDDVHLTDVTLALGETDLHLGEIALRARSDDDTLQIEALSVRGDDLMLQGAGALTPRGDWPLHWEGPWRVHVDELEVAGALQLSGSLADLRITQRVEAPARAALDARLALTGEAPAWEARLTFIEPLEAGRLDPDWPALALEGEVAGGGSFERFALDVDLAGQAPQLGAFTLRGAAGREATRWYVAALTLAQPAGTASLTVDGHLADPAADGTRRFAAELNWNELSWPPTPEEPPLALSRRGSLQADGHLEDYRVAGEFALQGADIPAGEWRVAGRGDLEHLTLERLHGSLLQGQLQAAGRLAWGEALQWSLTVDADGLVPGAHWEAAEGLQLDARLEGAGGIERFDVSGAVRANHAEHGPLAADLHLQRGAARWTLPRVLLSRPGQPGELEASARWDDAEGPDRLQLEARWRALALVDGLTAPAGHLTLGGNLDAYRFALDTELAGEALPDSRWSAQGAGNTEQIRLQHLRGETLDGELNAAGTVSWTPHLTWALELDVTGVNPGAHWSDWSGDLNLGLASEGRVQNGQPHARAVLQSRPSRLRGYELAAEAELTLAGERYSIERLELRAEDARISARGELDEAWALDWAIDAPDMAALLPEADGRLNAEGRLHGPRATPRLAIAADGERLAFGETRLDRLGVEADVDLGGRSASQVSVVLEGLEAGGQHWDRLTLEGSGTPASHSLQLTLDEARYHLRTVLAGAYEEARWTGAIRDTRLDAEVLPPWVQPTPAALSAGADAAEIDGFCLVGEDGGRLCLSGTWAPGTTGAQLTLNEVPLALLHPLLTSELELDGALGGHVAVRLDEAGLDVDARLGSAGGDLYYALGPDDRLRVPYRDLLLTASREGADLEARLSVALAEQDFLRGQVRAANLAAAPQALDQAALDGRLQTELRVLELLPLLVPELRDTHGVLSADIALGGTALDPEARGEITLEEGRAHVLATGITVQELQLRLSGDGREWRLTGSGRSGPGQITLGGEFELADPWRAVVTIDGDRFEAANMPEARVLVSPDLSVVVVPGAITVEGSVTVPEARLEPHDLGGAQTVSQDVIIVRGAESRVAEPLGWRITSRIRLVLGDRVRFEGFGLTGRITGSLRLVDEPGQVTTAAGQLSVLDGQYRAYGQNLRIDRGRLLFAVGQPLDNPGLDIRAVRVTRDVLAGVTVRGTLQNPELALFSEPSMDQANALSYLLLGRPLGQASQSEGEVLYGAATALSLAGGERIAQTIGEALGVEEVRIEEAPDAADAGPSLVLGTYLSPRLYLNYSVGLFESVNVLRLRYEISRHWILQTETGGRYDGADLIYSIERGGPAGAAAGSALDRQPVDTGPMEPLSPPPE